MNKPEVESFGSLILGVVNIVVLLVCCEFTPRFLPPLIACDIVVLDEEE